MRTLILVLAVSALVSVASVQAEDSDAHAITGSFDGIVWSSGMLWPITTVFDLDGSGELTGSYIYEETGGPFEGNLLRFRKTAERTWLVIWVEDSGSGTLEATFNEDFSSFVGLWSPLDDGDSGYPWVGERMD